MVIVILRFVFALENRIDTLQVIRSIIGPTEALPECMSCRIYSAADNSDSLILLEEWKSMDGLLGHIQSKEFNKVLAVMELASEPPKVEFLTISNKAGMELIEEARMTL